MKQDLILIGGGGHCKSCIEVIESQGRFAVAGIVDLAERLGQKVLGYEILATDQDLPGLVKDYGLFLVTIGQVKSVDRRRQAFETLKSLGAELPVVVSPLARVSPHAEVNEGTVVMHNAVVNAAARVGRNCIVNTCALIEHDAVIEDHCHVSTAAVVNGGVRMGEGTFLGSNAVVRENVSIGRGCVVGMGVRVYRNLPAGSLVKH
ncbi:MAG: acetyltransferase [Desulfovibrionaceae bacterium]|nr:acetyltransferase [Desulfovibrionaceae bacterium]